VVTNAESKDFKRFDIGQRAQLFEAFFFGGFWEVFIVVPVIVG